MPLSPNSGPGVPAEAFTGTTITTPLIGRMTDPDATPLQLTPVTGATADGTDQLEVFDDAGNLVARVAADGTLEIAGTSDAIVRVTLGGGRLLDIGPGGTSVYDPVFSTRWRLVNGAMQFLGLTAAALDIRLAASEFQLWLDDTPGATKLMVKAKDSGGTVRTGSLALT